MVGKCRWTLLTYSGEVRLDLGTDVASEDKGSWSAADAGEVQLDFDDSRWGSAARV